MRNHIIFATAILAGTMFCLRAQDDDFDDGDDNGWTRADPIAELGGGPFASFEVADGRYRLKGAVSPFPAFVGPARALAFRQDVVYEDSFFLSVDIPAYDADLEQAIGLIAMVQPSPSLGSTDGYTFTYQPITNDIWIARIVDEDIGASLSRIDLDVVPGPALRLVFVGVSGVMEGRLYNLDDLSTPLAVATATDTTFTSGTAGILVADNRDDSAGLADATFDNYVANDGSLPVPRLVASGSEFEIRYPGWAIHAVLETSSSLATGGWQPIPAARISRVDGVLKYADEFAVARAAHFRLRR